MVIREAVPGDSAAVCRICCDDLGYQCSEKFVRERLEKLDEQREAVFVADLNGEAVGFIQTDLYKTIYFETLVNIMGLAVSSLYRRQGAGRALFAKAEEWAREMSVSGIRICSGISRQEAHNFYRAMGCSEEKEQKRFLKKIG